MRRLLIVIGVFAIFAAGATPAHAQISFGRSVAVGDGEVFVGEPGNQATPGYVYVYRPDSGGWAEIAALSADDAMDADGFGSGIGIDGDRLVVGAELMGAGAVYVFEKQDGSWVQVAKIEAPNGVAGDLFGTSVGISGDRLIVGAPEVSGGNGAAYVFEMQGDRWQQVAALSGEGIDNERFGASVAIDGDRAIAGAPGGKIDFFLAGYASSATPGMAHVFERGDNGWEPAGRLTGSGAAAGAYFGHAVAIHSGQVMVGAPGANGLIGAVGLYFYDPAAGNWAQLPGLEPYDRVPGSYFGASIAFGDDEAFIGAPGAEGRLGRVYHFTRSGLTSWDSATKLGAANLGQFSILAAAVAASGDLLITGVPGNDYGAGTAVIMERDHIGWNRTEVLSATSGLDAVLGEGIPCIDGKAGPFLCDNVDMLAFLPTHMIGGGRGVGVNDIWGWTDPDTDRDYVVVGMRDGTTFIDVTDTSNPVWVGKLPKTDGANASLWRDVKVDKDHAFIVSDSAGEHGMQVFDMTRLREFTGTPLTFTPDATYTGVTSAHNMIVNPGSDFAFIVGSNGGGETCGGALHMINIEDPKKPAFVGCFADVMTGGGTGSSHDSQCVTYAGPDERYSGHEVCFSSNGTALSIGDVTDKRNPVVISRGEYPDTAYSHQGWLTDDHSYFYLNDELDEFSGLVEGTRTLIFDVRELDDPILVGTYQTDNEATDHNLYIVGDVMYQSNYRSGLRVVDISDRENPTALGYFDTVPWGSDFGMGDIISGSIGSWSNYPFFDSGVVVVASGREGVFVLRVRDR
ncbi:MAG: choice-of-anchor B family protein [Acidobacteria bacterium]|nr:choice-of-anchor B family protein [Acidobacteriota bacterium]